MSSVLISLCKMSDRGAALHLPWHGQSLMSGVNNSLVWLGQGQDKYYDYYYLDKQKQKKLPYVVSRFNLAGRSGFEFITRADHENENESYEKCTVCAKNTEHPD